MATYAIGDIQGCYDSLRALLERIQFDRRRDRLWLAGDLVNRGPKSLDVLRWARDLDDRVVAVLGNHDVHLLMRVAGLAREKKRDTLESVMRAPDRDELIAWLRRRPLVHVEDGHVMVHAGLHPAWSVADALAIARRITPHLRANDWRARMAALVAPEPNAWTADLPDDRRTRAALSVYIKLRTCRLDGEPCCEFSGPPRDAPPGCVPWFAVPGARWRDHCALFGHWSTLGLQVGDRHIALDSGCVWGGRLSAVRLDDHRIFQVAAVEVQPARGD